MNCFHCNTKLKKSKRYAWSTQNVGDFSIDTDKEVYTCPNCGNQLIPLGLWGTMELMEQERIEELLLKKIKHFSDISKDFISLKEASILLNKSWQAVKCDGKIKTLTYHVQIFGETFYYKKSIQQYINTGDGRLKLI